MGAAPTVADGQLTSTAICMAEGPDGNVWAREAQGLIARVTRQGVVTEFSPYGSPAPPVQPAIQSNHCIARAANSTIAYFASGPGGGAVGPPEVVEISTSGAVVAHVPITGADAAGFLTSTSDGTVWFSARRQSDTTLYLGKVSPTGVLTYPLIDSVSGLPIRALDLVVVNDRVWFSDELSRINWLDAAMALHTQPVSFDALSDIMAAGPDGRLWLLHQRVVHRIDEQGSFDLFAIPDTGVGCCNARQMVTGPDHAMWIVNGDQLLVRVTAQHTVITSDDLSASVGYWALVALDNGDIYLSDRVNRRIVPLGIGPWVNFSNRLYVDLLRRPADPDGVSFFTGQWLTGEIPNTAALAAILVGSDEYLLARVDDIYLELLGRHAEPAGQAYWAAQLRNGWRAEQLETAIIASDEYYAVRGHSDIGSYINAVYQDLLHRGPDQAGGSYWYGLLSTGTPRSEVAAGLVFSREALQNVVADFYERYLHRDTDTAGLNYWTDQLQAGMTDEYLVVLLTGSEEYFLDAQA